MTTPLPALVGSYDYRLVVLSVLISMLGAYATLELAERMIDGGKAVRLPWLIGALRAHAIAGGMRSRMWRFHHCSEVRLREIGDFCHGTLSAVRMRDSKNSRNDER